MHPPVRLLSLHRNPTMPANGPGLTAVAVDHHMGGARARASTIRSADPGR